MTSRALLESTQREQEAKAKKDNDSGSESGSATSTGDDIACPSPYKSLVGKRKQCRVLRHYAHRLAEVVILSLSPTVVAEMATDDFMAVFMYCSRPLLKRPQTRTQVARGWRLVRCTLHATPLMQLQQQWIAMIEHNLPTLGTVLRVREPEKLNLTSANGLRVIQVPLVGVVT